MKRKMAIVAYCVVLWIVILVLLLSSQYEKIAWGYTFAYMVCVSFLMISLVLRYTVRNGEEDKESV